MRVILAGLLRDEGQSWRGSLAVNEGFRKLYRSSGVDSNLTQLASQDDLTESEGYAWTRKPKALGRAAASGRGRAGAI